tara:strand:- start:25 stop:405 length:381 start_codon:yes stop_codon:yes gene_type:complete
MNLIPSTVNIEKEVAGYDSFRFLNKSKNVLLVFVLATSFYKIFGQGFVSWINVIWLILAIFIYFNQRWAIETYAVTVVAVTAIYTARLVPYSGTNVMLIPSIGLALLACILSYRAYLVANKLKNIC